MVYECVWLMDRLSRRSDQTCEKGRQSLRLNLAFVGLISCDWDRTFRPIFLALLYNGDSLSYRSDSGCIPLLVVSLDYT